MVPLVTSLAQDPLLSIVGLVFTFVKIYLFAVIAELFGFVGLRANVTEP
jgi:hypothetical protein